MANKITRIFLIFSFLLASPSVVFAYGQLEFVNDSGVVAGEKWFDVPTGGAIAYRIDSQTRPSFIPAIDAAHATWEQFSAIEFENAGSIDAPLFSTGLGDGFNTHSFAATDVLFGGSGVAFAPTVTNTATGEILEADVYYNPKARWSTGDNLRGRKVDVQSVAFHELGHFHGLSHSAITDATMFPSIQPGIEARSPEADDQISPALIYPVDVGEEIPTGSISGRIINGADSTDGIVGGIVFAFPAAEEPLETFDQAFAHDYSGTVQGRTPAKNTTGPLSGEYTIEGLPPGDYLVFLVPTGDGLIEANQISEYLAAFAEGGFPREFYNGVEESNDEADRFARVPVTVGTTDTGGINIITETGAAGPAPIVTLADPDNGAVNTRSLDVTILGQNFVNGATVSFSGKHISVRSVSFSDATQLDINIRIGRKAESGPRDVTVTNPDGQSGAGEGIFTVTP